MPYIGKQPQVGNYIKLDAITTSATATYNLLSGGSAVSPQTATNCIVSLNGVIQAPTDAYTISGSTIVFSSALTASDVIDFITVLGDVLTIGTPTDGTVTNVKIANSTIDLTTKVTGTLPVANGGTGFTTLAGAGLANTPAFHARMSTTQTISNNTSTKVNFNTEEFDTDSAYDTSTYRFTVPSGQTGKYFIYASIQGFMSDVPSALQAVYLSIYKNNSEVSFNGTDPRNNNGYFFTAYSHLTLSLVATDYIEIFGYIIGTSGTNTITNRGLTYTNSFGAYKLIGV